MKYGGILVDKIPKRADDLLDGAHRFGFDLFRQLLEPRMMHKLDAVHKLHLLGSARWDDHLHPLGRAHRFLAEYVLFLRPQYRRKQDIERDTKQSTQKQ